MAQTRTSEEKIALDQLIYNINMTMVRFREETGKQQNDEQKKGLMQIQTDFNANLLEPDMMYFIGRFNIAEGSLKNEIAEVTQDISKYFPKDAGGLRLIGYDMPRFMVIKSITNNIIKAYVADKLGISQNEKSALKIEPSSMESLIKVSINGHAINNFIAIKINQAQTKDESISNTRIDLSKEIIKDILQVFSGDYSSGWKFSPFQVICPAYSISEANTQFVMIREKLESVGIDIGGNLMFLADSSETGKKRVIVDCNKFNNALDNEKLDKLKDIMTEIKNTYSKMPESEQHVQGCNNVLDYLSQHQPAQSFILRTSNK